MSECIEFRMNSNLWKLPLLLAVPFGLLSYSCIGMMFMTWEIKHGMIAFAFIFSFCAYIVSSFIKKRNSTILITRYALHYGTQSFFFDDIKEIQLTDPNKIILRIDGGAMEYQTPIKLSDISYGQREDFLKILRKISEKLGESKNKHKSIDIN